jgi:superfamily II DNA or RNA helicase
MTLAYNPTLAAQPARDYQAELTTALINATTPLEPGSKLLVEVATGGGKRRIINDFLAARILQKPGLKALVVTKDWQLVAQNAEDLVARHVGALSQISYVGGEQAAQLFHPAIPGIDGLIVFTTIQSWFSRRYTDFANIDFEVICVDEVHWGEHGSYYKELCHRQPRATFVGATATPRTTTDFKRVGRAFRFGELVERGTLARPEVITINTHVTWSPQTSAGHFDFLPSSLSELGENQHRNQSIVRTYLAGREKYGKTIIFACSIEHSETIASMLQDGSVRAAAIHSKQPPEERAAAMTAFQTSQLDVLVNMAILTHGVDIPDVASIFLARPTRSEILLSQMIGRGARRTATKMSFHVVDFCDAVSESGLYAIRAEGFLASRRGNATLRCPTIAAHAFEPAAFVVLDSMPGYEALAGLEIQPQQTFGIEFEAAPRHSSQFQYTPTAIALLTYLNGVVPPFPVAHAPMATAHRTAKNNKYWNVEPDSSCGLEVTTRILRGEDGFREVVDACRAIEAAHTSLKLTSNSKSVGTHIHLGATLNLQQLTSLMTIVAYFEPAILSLVAPSRAMSRYVRSVRGFLRRLASQPRTSTDFAPLVESASKYLGASPINLASGGLGTVEIRYHSGTVDAGKILQWVSLWMRIIDAARHGGSPGNPLRRVLSRPLCEGPRGDVVELCKFVGAGPALTARMTKRRDEIVGTSWAKHPQFGARARQLLIYWGESNVDTPRSYTSTTRDRPPANCAV